MLKTIAAIIVLAVAAIVILAATKPDMLRVERKASMQATPDKIFPLINDFHNWPSWSPYEKLDPQMRRTLSGAPNGKGAVYEWAGERKVGQGRMEITDTAPPSRVTIKLDFIEPFEGHNTAEFLLEPKGGDVTEVTWVMQGPCPYIAKVMSVFVNMDKMIGKDFEAGLANLRTIAEK